MFVTARGQVTIPKPIRQAAGIVPGSEVEFSLEGSRIVITLRPTGLGTERRIKLKAAAAKVKQSLGSEFSQLGADEILSFIRG
jgi:antitoxin PrlF